MSTPGRWVDAERVLVFGGRNYRDVARVDRSMQHIAKMFKSFAVIEGGATGADRLARLWGKKHGIPVLTVEANWDFYDKAAGMIRNEWMRDICSPTYGVAFPGGTGTAGMLSLLKEINCPVWVIQEKK